MSVHSDLRAGIDLYIIIENGSGASGRGAGGTEVEVVTSGQLTLTSALCAAGPKSIGLTLEGAIVIDAASITIDTSCKYGAAGKPAEPHGEGTVLALSVNCVITGNTGFEPGLIRGTPLTDNAMSDHSCSIGCLEEQAVPAEVHVKVNKSRGDVLDLDHAELQHLEHEESDSGIAALLTVGLKCLQDCTSSLEVKSTPEKIVFVHEIEKIAKDLAVALIDPCGDPDTENGDAVTVLTILRINILNLLATTVVGSTVCNVYVKGSKFKFRAKILSVFGLQAAVDHSKVVGSQDDSDVSGHQSAGPGRVIRTGNLGLSSFETLEVTNVNDSIAIVASLGNCNPEGCTSLDAKTNHSVLLLSATVHVSVGMTDPDPEIQLSGIDVDGNDAHPKDTRFINVEAVVAADGSASCETPSKDHVLAPDGDYCRKGSDALEGESPVRNDKLIHACK